MAYITQDTKKIIAASMKERLKGFPSVKFSLAIRDHMTLVVTIKSGPFILMSPNGHVRVNQYSIEENFVGVAAQILTIIKECSDAFNHDNSDVQSDYFDVGHYLSINIGTYEVPYKSV